jgi:amino acid transporter
MLLTVMLCFGVKESTAFNSVFTIFNCTIVIFVVVMGILNADFANWTISPEEAAKHDAGNGGFFPYGLKGLLAASASCF